MSMKIEYRACGPQGDREQLSDYFAAPLGAMLTPSSTGSDSSEVANHRFEKSCLSCIALFCVLNTDPHT